VEFYEYEVPPAELDAIPDGVVIDDPN